VAAAAFGSAAEARAGAPTAEAAVSKAYAKRLLRRWIRDADPGLIPGSILIFNCHKGRTRDGWPRVYCHDISWDTHRPNGRRTVCGWGRVVEHTTYFNYRVFPQRFC
jgi:hypothetical protein